MGENRNRTISNKLKKLQLENNFNFYQFSRKCWRIAKKKKKEIGSRLIFKTVFSIGKNFSSTLFCNFQCCSKCTFRVKLLHRSSNGQHFLQRVTLKMKKQNKTKKNITTQVASECYKTLHLKSVAAIARRVV